MISKLRNGANVNRNGSIIDTSSIVSPLHLFKASLIVMAYMLVSFISHWMPTLLLLNQK